MAQWINLIRNSRLINLMRLPVLCEKSGDVALVLPGLRQADRQEGRQSEEIVLN